MSRYANEDKPETRSGGKPGIENVRQAVHNTLQSYLAAMQQTVLPDPMPPNIGSAVEWWIKTMQEPERRHERPHTASVIGKNNSRWEYGYLLRVVNNLRAFLSLKRQDREMVAAAREDGVYWRGETIATLLEVVKQQEEMRKVGVKQYTKAIAPGLAKMRRKARVAA